MTRAVRLVADVLGDAAIVYRRDADGQLAVEQVAHRDPVAEVVATTVAHDARSTTDLIEHVIESGESVFVPTVHA